MNNDSILYALRNQLAKTESTDDRRFRYWNDCRNIINGINDCYNAYMEMIGLAIYNYRLRKYFKEREDKYTLNELLEKEDIK